MAGPSTQMAGERAPLDPKQLFETMAGFKGAAVLRAAVDLRVFDALADGAATPGEVASRLEVPERGVRSLLGALAGLSLVELDGDTFSLAPGADTFLVTSSPKYCGGITRVASGQEEWELLGQLADTVRRGGPVPGHDSATATGYWVDFATHTTFATEKLGNLLAEVLGTWGDGILAPRVLDVGCGHGLHGMALAQRWPEAQISLCDSAEVLDVAAGHAARKGVADRVEMLAGGPQRPLEGTWDVILVVNLLFHYDRGQAATIVDGLVKHLAPGGRLVIAGFTTGDVPPAQEPHAHFLGLLGLSWTEGGEMHSTSAYREMLADGGLGATEVHARPGLPLRLVIGRSADGAAVGAGAEGREASSRD